MTPVFRFLFICILLVAAMATSCSKPAAVESATSADIPCDGVRFNGQCVDKGDIVTFGSYLQNNETPEPINWRVLDIKSNDQILVISEKVLDVQLYNTSCISMTWDNSTIRSWLNGYPASYNTVGNDYTGANFIDTAFTTEEKAKMIVSNVPAHANPDAVSEEDSEDEPECSPSPGNATTDKVFLLSLVEVRNYFGDKVDHRADATRYAVKEGVHALGSETNNYTSDGTCTDEHCYAFWWLRSPGCDSVDAAFINYQVKDYEEFERVDMKGIGVRPAMWMHAD